MKETYFFPSFIGHEIKKEQTQIDEPLKKGLKIKENTQVVFFYGAINNSLAKQLIIWLKSSDKHRLYCIGKSPSDLGSLVKMLEGKDLIPQLLITLESYCSESFLSSISWDILFDDFEILSSEEDQTFCHLAQKITVALSTMRALISECRDFYHNKYRNTLDNIKLLRPFHFLSQLQGVLNQVPAVICGAGESLMLDLKALPLSANKAIVIAAGSAARILSDLKIGFDLAVFIDPCPLFERFQKMDLFEPLWVSCFQNASFFSKIFHGSCVIAEDKNNLLEKDILKKFYETKIEHEYGWNVGNFAAFVAAYLGCDPIIMTGMDMGFAHQEYALDLERENKKHRQDSLLSQNFFSRTDLILGQKYFETLPQTFSSTQFFQSNQSLISPKGFCKKNLEEFMLEQQNCDIKGLLHQKVMTKALCHLAKDNIFQYEEKMKKELSQAVTILERIKNKCQSFQGQGESPQTIKEEYFALEEFELESLEIYPIFLASIWPIWKHLLDRDKKDNFGKVLNKYLFFERVVKNFLKILH